jgi:hypothetical protein
VGTRVVRWITLASLAPAFSGQPPFSVPPPAPVAVVFRLLDHPEPDVDCPTLMSDVRQVVQARSGQVEGDGWG